MPAQRKAHKRRHASGIRGLRPVAATNGRHVVDNGVFAVFGA
jgi:hypothetical protein